MRLIDADKLIEHLNDYALQEAPFNGENKDVYDAIKQCIEAIEEQPTVYNIEKIVNQINEERELSNADFEKYVKEKNLCLDSEYDDWFFNGLKRAEEIVKSWSQIVSITENESEVLNLKDNDISTMALDEAIEHARNVASEQKRRSEECTQIDDNCDEFLSCLKCAKEHEQLAEWLTQLKEYQRLEEQRRKTNADRIRNMSDKELAEWICFMYETESCGEPFRSIYNFNTDEEEGIHDSYEDWLDWLQSDAEQERG